MVESYKNIAARIVEENLSIKPNERVLVVTDSLCEDFGRAFFDACQEQGLNNCVLALIPVTRTDGEEPPDTLGQAMERAEVIIAITHFTLTHGKATKRALEQGARVLSIPGLNARIFQSQAMQGTESMVHNTKRITELLSSGFTARLVSPAGTNLRFEIGGWDRLGGADTGEIKEPGLLANLPAGESLISPLEGTVYGTAIIDASISGGIGKLKDKVILEIEAGRIVSIKGGDQARTLQKILEASDENSFNIAEVAFGINPFAEIIGNIILDEKTVGTAHLGIGNSKMLGGSIYSNVHIDAVFHNPHLEVDGHLIIEGDRFHTGTVPWELLDYHSYTDAINGKIKVTGDFEIKDGCLFKKWKCVMGRNFSTRVGTEEAAKKCAKVVQCLDDGDDGIKSLEEIAEASAFTLQEAGRVVNMLKRYKIIEILT